MEYWRVVYHANCVCILIRPVPFPTTVGLKSEPCNARLLPPLQRLTFQGLGFGAVPTSGNVIWKAGICEFSTSAPVFLAADVSSATAVPADVDDVTEATIALTMTSLAAADEVVLFIGRDADNGSDTAAGDAILITASFEYVAS